MEPTQYTLIKSGENVYWYRAEDKRWWPLDPIPHCGDCAWMDSIPHSEMLGPIEVISTPET